MDNYLDKKRFNSYYLMLAQREASNLKSYARQVSAYHLKNLVPHLNFNNEIDKFIDAQLQGIGTAKNDRECREYLSNLKKERILINNQDIALKNGSAKVLVSAKLINKLDAWGYVINGVGVILGGFQIIAGFGIAAGSVSHGNAIGIAGGGLLILHGYNSVKEGFTNIYYGRNDSVGNVKKGYIAAASFMGFDSKVGGMAYSMMDLTLSGYGMSRLVLKPDTWRLFRHIPSDYVRNFRTMTAPSLLMEGAGDAISIKATYDNAN